MSVRDDFFAAKAKGSLWDVAVSIKRGNPLPLDADSIFESYEALEAYASDVLAYPGQVVAVVNADSTGIYYLDQELAIKPVGIIPQGDGKSIEVTADGIISIAGVDTAESLTLPRMKADKSGIEWVPVSAVVQGDGNDNTTYEFTALEDKVGFSVVTKFNGEQVGEAVEYVLDAYTKAEADEKFLTKADYTPYDDTALAGKVDDLEEAIGDVNGGLIKNLNDEIARAQLAESGLSDRIDAIDFVDPNELADAIKDFATKAYVDGAIDVVEETIAKLNHFTAKVVNSIDEVTEIGVLYLIKDESVAGVDKYNEYIVVDNAPVLIGDTTTDLSNYYDKDAIDGKVEVINTAIADEAVARELLAGRVSVLEGVDYATQNELDAYKSVVTQEINAAKTAVLGDVAKDYATKAEIETLEGEIEEAYAKKETTLAGYGITDAYTAAQTDAAILAKIGEMTGGESAADVLALLNAYKASNDREVWGDEFVNNATTDGKYNPTYSGNSRIDDLKAKVDDIEANAEVNIIEKVKVNGVELTPDADKAVNVIVPTDITGMGGYSALDERVTAAKTQADKGVTDASAAAAKADTNAEEIGKHNTRITTLETAKTDHENRIGVLEGKESTHASEYSVLKGRVDGHDTAIAGKAAQADLTAANQEIAKNATAIKAINETTIPAVNEEIGKKANINDVYNKTSADEKFLAKADYTPYNDAEVKASIKAIADDYLKAADKTDLNNAIAALAGENNSSTVKANADAIALINGADAGKSMRDVAGEEALKIVDGAPEAYNTLKEVAAWIENDQTGAAAMAANINKNKAAIAAIYEVVDGKAAGVLVDEIARVEKKADDNATAILAINNGETGILAQAKAYADTVVKVDDNTIKMNADKKLYVNKVSTDILELGTLELILCGGDSGVAAE